MVWSVVCGVVRLPQSSLLLLRACCGWPASGFRPQANAQFHSIQYVSHVGTTGTRSFLIHIHERGQVVIKELFFYVSTCGAPRVAITLNIEANIVNCKRVNKAAKYRVQSFFVHVRAVVVVSVQYWGLVCRQ